MATNDFLIVGGGIIGAAVARELAKGGASVTILDSGREPGIATQASAGMLAPVAETGPDDPLLGLAVRARDLYGELTASLKDETGVDVGLWTDGILKVAFTEEEETVARASIAWQRQQGLNSDWLDAGDVRQRCPGLTPEIRGALLAPEDGALKPLALLEALLVSATNRGARIVRNVRVTGLITDAGRATGVQTDDGPREGGAVVLAAGAWAGRIEGLPRPLSVEPIRGQMASFDWPEGEPPSIIYSPGGYVLKRGPELLAGSTMEYVGFDAGITDEAQDRIASQARRLYPRLAEQPVRRRWAGLRPGTPDGRPIIGRDPRVPNLWYATGHGRNGILLAAITGEIIAALVSETPLEYALPPLDPGRFWH